MKPDRARREQRPAILTMVLLLSACATVPERSYCQSAGPGKTTTDACVEDARRPYWDFILRKDRTLRQSGDSEEDRRREQLVLAEMTVWMHGQDAASLSRTPPDNLYFRLRAARRQQEREEAERAAAVELKLDEFFTWALRRWEESSMRFRSVGREYLMTEHPLRQQTQDALTAAVLDWAFTHTQDPDFLSKSPSEVAVYLLAKNSALLTAIELGQLAPPHLDYVPVPDETAATPEDLAIELLIGVVPLVGEAADLQALMTGQSVTGRKLRKEEKLLAAVGVLLPFVSGQALAGAGMMGRAAVLTGRGLEEVRVLQRVASHLNPREAQKVERMLRAAAKGERMREGDVALLQRIAQKLERPLRDAAGTLRQGGKVPFLGVRKGEGGMKLVPGEPAHVAQCWVDYQFRHPGRYPRFTYAPDEEWKRLYESILRNKEAGTAFEGEVLKAGKYEKNVALMMPPPGSKLPGFIPDAVSGNPGELVWGRAYRFVEVKARAKLDLGGNLKAMLYYVNAHGGHLELWVRSAKHPSGPTRLSDSLQDFLSGLAASGLATVKYHP
jgi:Pre-toxin TG